MCITNGGRCSPPRYIEAAVARFGELDDYYILDEVTLLFGNGKVNVEPQYEAQLVRLDKSAQ